VNEEKSGSLNKFKKGHQIISFLVVSIERLTKRTIDEPRFLICGAFCVVKDTELTSFIHKLLTRV